MWIAAVWTSLRLTSHGVCGVVADWRHLCCLESLPWGCSSSLVNYRKWAKKKDPYFFFSQSCGSLHRLCLTFCSPMDWSTPGFNVLHCLPEFAQTLSIESVMPCNHFILCHPFFCCLQFSPASGSFPVSQFFASGGQSVDASASASVLPMNIHWI